ncbi:hypothetical protein KKR91_01310 [Arthrobacter jiangjiafuii]|uniref:Uncharacterized protein n=1 Tax=Arthrobacter jiangjiafuii TaxID=2817475 RepID=A0A975R0K8_9MICC|nr:hypothetical protein [Arthrobacter jiangjiafuii]MBP3044854.1 hypothetical protein [Arthrobacter jiangjiafuii]QWC10322.1 hypothetical protein KKR91_01310 [Arthrobacter jiangjiafuii]
MKIYLIWAVVENENDAPWLVAAWDEYCMDSNSEGWMEELAKARSEYGAGNIRVTTTLAVDYDKVVRAFEPADVTPDVIET